MGRLLEENEEKETVGRINRLVAAANMFGVAICIVTDHSHDPCDMH